MSSPFNMCGAKTVESQHPALFQTAFSNKSRKTFGSREDTDGKVQRLSSFSKHEGGEEQPACTTAHPSNVMNLK